MIDMTMRAAFFAAHRQLYGFADERAAPVVATLQVAMATFPTILACQRGRLGQSFSFT